MMFVVGIFYIQPEADVLQFQLTEQQRGVGLNRVLTEVESLASCLVVVKERKLWEREEPSATSRTFVVTS